MDERRQLMAQRMMKVVVTGVETGTIRAKDIHPLIDRVKSYYDKAFSARDLVGVYGDVGLFTSRRAFIPTPYALASVLALGKKLEILGSFKDVIPSEITDTLDVLARVIAMAEDNALNLSRSDSLSWILTSRLVVEIGRFPTIVPRTKDFRRFCELLAIIREDQGVIDTDTVAAYLLSRYNYVAYPSTVNAYFDAVVRNDQSLDGGESDISLRETLIRCALKMGNMPSAEYMTYKLVDVEAQKPAS